MQIPEQNVTLPADLIEQAQRWAASNGLPSANAVEQIVRTALDTPPAIPVQPAAAWTRRASQLKTGHWILATALNDHPRTGEVDDLIAAIPGATYVWGQSARRWHRLPFSHLPALRTLLGPVADRVRLMEVGHPEG